MANSPLSRFSMFKKEPSEASSEHSLPVEPKEEFMDIDDAASDATNETPHQPDFMDSYTRRGERTFDGADSWDESASPIPFADELDSTQEFAELTSMRLDQDMDGDDMIPEDIDDEGDLNMREDRDNEMSPIPEDVDDEGNLTLSEDISVVSPTGSSKPDMKVDVAKPEVKPDLKPYTKTIAKPIAKPIAKSCAKPDVKPDVKPITKTIAKPIRSYNHAYAKPRFRKKIHTSPTLLKMNTGSPRCLLCPVRPRTMNAFVDHMRAHRTTLKENGIYLLCSCDFKTYYRKAMAKHDNICDGTVFTIQEREDPTETPECIICPDHPRSLGGYIEHLRDYHDSTLKQNGIFLHCSCGFNACYRSALKRHAHGCKGTDFTVHEREIEQNPVVPDTPHNKCVKCDSHRKSISAYVHHIHDHKSTLKASGIFLQCSCDFKLTYRGGLRFHDKECDGSEFTVHERETERDTERETNVVVQKTPKCVMCHRHPKSLGDYVDHITNGHKSTLNANGIYLICSCDVEVRNINGMAKHSKKCDGRQFTVRKKTKVVDKTVKVKVEVAPVCGFCGESPKSAFDFAFHLQYNHGSSLYDSGIYLACSCGYEFRPGVPFSDHNDNCDGRNFTVHDLDEK